MTAGFRNSKTVIVWMHKKNYVLQIVSIRKLGILFEIEACGNFYHRHILDIPGINISA